MAWYVFALLDAAPSRRMGRGLSSAISVREMDACFVAAERSADVPPIDLGALTLHHAIVARLWRLAPAVLPVRFGTLLDFSEIAEALEGRDEELREAFNLVHRRGQFSWRARHARGSPPGPPLGARPGTVVAQGATISGTEYLRRAARPVAPPPRFSAIRDAVGPFIAGERYQAAGTMIPETLYHLVDRLRMDDYRAAASRIPPSPNLPTLSGPFPAYAFVPEVLG